MTKNEIKELEETMETVADYALEILKRDAMNDDEVDSLWEDLF